MKPVKEMLTVWKVKAKIAQSRPAPKTIRTFIVIRHSK